MYITLIDTQSNISCADCDVSDWFDQIFDVVFSSGTVSPETIEQTFCTFAVLQQALILLNGWTDVAKMLSLDNYEDEPFYLSGRITEKVVNPNPSAKLVAKLAEGAQNYITVVQLKWPAGLARAMMKSAISSLEQLTEEINLND